MKNLEDIKAPKNGVENNEQVNEPVGGTIGSSDSGSDSIPAPEMSNVASEDKGGSNILKFVIALIVLVGIGGGSVFAYMQINPFFLKSKEDVFKEMLTNTFDRISEGNFSVDSNIKFDVNDNGTQINTEIPFGLTMSEIKENKIPDVAISVGDIDVSPFVDYAMGGMFPTAGLDNIFAAEMRLFEDSVFFKVDSVPEILSMFLPADDLVVKYSGSWISSDIEEIESMSGVDISDEEEITDDQLDYTFNRLSQAVLEDANPVIELEKEDGQTKIVYTSDFVKFAESMELAIKDIEEYMGDEIDIYFEDFEDVEGTIKNVIYVDNDLIISRLETEVEWIDETYGYPTEVKTGVSVGFNYSDNIVIERPNSEFTFEDLMGDVMMLMFMGMGGEQDTIEVTGNTTNDSEIKSTLSNARALAELYYDSNGSYNGVCANELKDFFDSYSFSHSCLEGSNSWAVTSQLSNGNKFCSDSEGVAAEIYTDVVSNNGKVSCY